MTTDVQTVLFTKDEARAETKALKRLIEVQGRSIEALRERLQEADRREVWKALGYRSMGGYITGELGMSRANAYRVLDQVRAQLQLTSGQVSRSETLAGPPAVPTQREATRITAPLKQKRGHRGPPDKMSVIRAMGAAIDNFNAKSEGYEVEEILAYLTADERRELERFVTKATQFCEEWGDLLSRPVERRPLEESA